MAMMSRWTSLVPPPKVKMVWLREFCSSRPREHGSGRALRQVAGLAHDLEQEPVGLQGELRAEHLGGRGVGRVEPLVRPPRPPSS